jgi:hypothetical protein
MALPVLTTPKYKLTIPSNGKEISYRPFVVKEEKILLMAKESKDPKEVIDSIKEVIAACTYNEVDVQSLATFDIEYIFLQIRSKAVSNTAEIALKCNHELEDGRYCDNKINLIVNLSTIKVEIPEGHTKKIPLTDTVGVVMRYPTFDLIDSLGIFKQEIADIKEGIEKVDLFKVIQESIELIWDGEELFYAKDASPEEMCAFMDSMTEEQFKKVRNFMDTIPSITHTVKFKCPVCLNESLYTFKGISDFFS